MKVRINRLVLGLALTGCATLAHAAGFALIEQNASGLGNAYAGQAASAQDEFTGTAVINNNPSTPLSGGNGGDAGDLAFVPNAYFAYRVSPDIHVGMGLNAPFGLKTEYDSSWKGRTQAIKSELKTINLNPAIAWKASESLSLGAGLSIQYTEATLSNSANGAGIATVSGDDYG
ncbi:MAG: long chain fatty acid transport protein, partial [Proteobacteria bacterium]|nr:long chain fatty acid transport protein [Pseudomonadota bacterium]